MERACSSICYKLSRVIYLERKLATELPNDILRHTYFVFFEIHVCYGIRLWCHAAMRACEKILLLQQ